MVEDLHLKPNHERTMVFTVRNPTEMADGSTSTRGLLAGRLSLERRHLSDKTGFPVCLPF